MNKRNSTEQISKITLNNKKQSMISTSHNKHLSLDVNTSNIKLSKKLSNPIDTNINKNLTDKFNKISTSDRESNKKLNNFRSKSVIAQEKVKKEQITKNPTKRVINVKKNNKLNKSVKAKQEVIIKNEPKVEDKPKETLKPKFINDFQIKLEKEIENRKKNIVERYNKHLDEMRKLNQFTNSEQISSIRTSSSINKNNCSFNSMSSTSMLDFHGKKTTLEDRKAKLTEELNKLRQEEEKSFLQETNKNILSTNKKEILKDDKQKASNNVKATNEQKVIVNITKSAKVVSKSINFNKAHQGKLETIEKQEKQEITKNIKKNNQKPSNKQPSQKLKNNKN